MESESKVINQKPETLSEKQELEIVEFGQCAIKIMAIVNGTVDLKLVQIACFWFLVSHFLVDENQGFGLLCFS